MKALLPFAGVVTGLLAWSPSLWADEKNGVSLMVTKKTLERNDTRSPYYYSGDRIDRTQGLKAAIRNTTIKPQPEGEVKWTILVRKNSYSSSGTLDGSTGTEKLNALKSSETLEMVLGAAQITGWRDGYDAAKDKFEYQVIVSQDGVEKVRVQSTAAFDALAKRARLTKSDGSRESVMELQKPATKTPVTATPKPTSATPRPSAQVPPNPFAGPRATPTPAPKAPVETDAPLDGSKLK